MAMVMAAGLSPVQVDLTTDRDGRSRGFGIAKFANGEEAHAAVIKLNGQELDGRVITCKVDQFNF